MKREIALKIAWSYLGKWYKWGGDDPSGFDCSGFIVEILKSVGIIERGKDYTAQGLYRKFRDKITVFPGPGSLVFYQDGAYNIIHVELCLNEELAIGASGGSSRTLKVWDAIRDNAFIKIRPIRSRSNVAGFIDVF